jgi:GT2 family glycosyltransferase
MPDFTVIVLNWNGKHFLDVCLSALRKQLYSKFDVLLVDNASADGSAEFVETHFPEVKLIRLQENRGFVGGNLAGYERATGEWIVLLNNDTEADPCWLQGLSEAIRCHPEAGVLASKMLFYDERDRIDNCGFDVAAACTTIDLGRGEKDSDRWSRAAKVFGACGGAVAYRKSMLEQIGFLDPDFFMTFEDADLSFRAQLMGYECTFVPTAIVYHRYRGTMSKYPARQVYFSQRNIEFVYLKNMPTAIMLRYLPQRLMYEIGSAIYFTRMGVGKAFFKAKIDVLRQLPAVLKKRREIQSRRTIADAQLLTMLKRYHLGPKFKKFLSAFRRPKVSSVQESVTSA